MSNNLFQLGDLITIKHGFAFKGEYFSEKPTHYQLVTPGNFALGGGFQLGKGKFYSGPIPEDYILKTDDLIVTMTDLSKQADTLGFAAKVPKTEGTTWLHNQRIGLVQVKKNSKLLPEYLYYLMRSDRYRQNIVASATGSTVKHTSPGRIYAYKFNLPSMDEQNWIASILASLDDRIILLREANFTLESIAQALFKSWFIDFDPVHAKAEGREPEGMDAETAALFPDGFEESKLGLIPKGWSIAKIEKVLELAYGKALKAIDRIFGSVPVYGSGGVTGYHNEALINEPSVIVGRKGTVGSLYWENQPFFPIDTVFYVKAKVPLTYCYYLLQTLGLTEMNTDGAVPGLNRNNVYRLQIAKSSNEIIQAFDEVVMPIRKKIFSNSEQINILIKLRDKLLPRLISGQLCLSEVEEMVGVL